MATHPTESQALVKVRPADPDEAVVIDRYVRVRTAPDSDERRAATKDLERLCHFRGTLSHRGVLYSYDRHEGSLFIDPVTVEPVKRLTPDGEPVRGPGASYMFARRSHRPSKRA